MGREIRRVPANWKHPKEWVPGNMYRPQGEMRYKPLYDGNFDDAVKDYHEELKEWLERYYKWQEGYIWSYSSDKYVQLKPYLKRLLNEYKTERDYETEDIEKLEHGTYSYDDWTGGPPSYPNPGNYMPKGKWYQLFETVSEGTPLSPPFKTKKELVDWLSNNLDEWGHKWTPEQAAAMVKSEWAPSGIISNGKMYSAEESTVL